MNYKHNIEDLHTLRTSFHEFCGFFMSQTYSVLYCLGRVFVFNRNIKYIVEIGTGQGGLTLFFGVNMLARGGKVISFDISRPLPQWFVAKKKFPIKFYQLDVFGEEAAEIVENFIKEVPKDEKLLIFCDGGNKPKEMLKYSKMLRPGDFIMAHDWMKEIWEFNVKDMPYLEYYEQNMFDTHKTRVLSMKRKLEN